MANRPPLIGSAEACELLRIDPSTLSRWVAQSKITPAQKLPGKTGPFLFEREEIEQLAAGQAATAPAATCP